MIQLFSQQKLDLLEVLQTFYKKGKLMEISTGLNLLK